MAQQENKRENRVDLRSRSTRRHVSIALPTEEDAIAIFALVVFGVVGLIGLTYTYERQDKPAQETRTSQQLSASEQTQNSDQSKTGQVPQITENQEPPWYSHRDAPQWVLAAIGAITFFFLGWQAWETRKSAQAAETTLCVIQSPRVFCERVDVIHIAAGERPAVIVHFQNAGTSPAVRCWLTVAFRLFDKEQGPTAHECRSTLDPRIGTRQGQFSIAGGQRIYLPVAMNTALTTADLTGLSDTSKRLWAYGAGEFFDPINEKTVTFVYAARYIVFGWDQPRPKFPSDFWIFNDF